MKDYHSIISENLAVMRKSSGLTQAQLAERLGYSDKAVSRWEKGDTLPDINVLAELCDFYGITMNLLLEKGGGTDQRQIKSRGSKQYSITICLLAIAMIWLIATVLFVYLITIGGVNFWQVFVWALPACCVVILAMTRKYHNHSLTFVTATVLTWTLITAFYLQFLRYNIWAIYFIGIPVQAIFIIWLVYTKLKRM